jgi:type IV conjugative transfer system protein TraE
MEIRYSKEIASRYYKQRNIAIIIGMIMLGINGVLSLSILGKREKTVIVPAYLKQTVWTQGELVSASYIEEMSRYFSELLLDSTPDNYKYKRDVILRYVAPSYHNIVEKQLIEEEQKMRKSNLTTDFVIKKIIVNEKNYQGLVVGSLVKYVAGQRVSESEEKILIKFGYESGIMMVREFKRVIENDE